MDKRAKVLGWIGLIGGGVISVGGNIRSLWLPEYVETGWRDLTEVAPQDPGAFVLAIVLPLLALAGVEMVNAWTHLPRAIRFGVLGLVSFCALASSFTHVVLVFMWYGQPPALAVLGAAAIDGVMILSGLALFTEAKVSDVQPDTDTAPDTDTDTDADADADTDTAPDTVPDMDTLPAAPVDTVDWRTMDTDTVDWKKVPARRPRADKAWMAAAVEMIQRGEPDSDRGIAEKILAEHPDTWTGKDPVEAGRKAVSRLRASL